MLKLSQPSPFFVPTISNKLGQHFGWVLVRVHLLLHYQAFFVDSSLVSKGN